MIEVSGVPKFDISCSNVRPFSRNLTLTLTNTINRRLSRLLCTQSQLVDKKSHPPPAPHLATDSCSATADLIWSLDPQFQWQCVQLQAYINCAILPPPLVPFWSTRNNFTIVWHDLWSKTQYGNLDCRYNFSSNSGVEVLRLYWHTGTSNFASSVRGTLN